jgi:uncharacterized protein YgfB (UPF0149 family)
MSSSADLSALAINALAGPAGTLTASELHGAVVGIAVASTDSFSLQTLVDLLGADALAGAEDLEPFVRQTLLELMAEDLSFAPLLPDDEAPLPGRVEALAEWTASFLAGLVAALDGGEEVLEALPEEAAEITRDFLAIAQVAPESDEADDAEADFLQLSEFVKVGTLLIMSALPGAGDDRGE